MKTLTQQRIEIVKTKLDLRLNLLDALDDKDAIDFLIAAVDDLIDAQLEGADDMEVGS